jgi:hypothetical protein
MSEAGRKRFEQFRSGYPDGIVDVEAAEREFAGLPEPDQAACAAGIAAYAARCKRRREKSMKAHLFIRKRGWIGIAAPSETAATSGLYEPKSTAGQAVLILGRMAHSSPATIGDGRLIYRGEITPRLLAMAASPSEDAWGRYERGTANFAAWRDFISEVFAGRALPVLTEVHAPWPWPPRKDGSTGESTGPPPLIPGTLATTQDVEDFVK